MAFEIQSKMQDRLEESLQKFNRLTEEISRPDVISNRTQFSSLSKERSALEDISRIYVEFKKAFEDYLGSKEMLQIESDSELKKMAQMEIEELEPKLEQLHKEMQILLLPRDPNDEKNIILELRAGVGGDEAGLFCAELFRAYLRYAESQCWRTEMLSLADNAAGGYKEAVASIEGERVYAKLKYESGVHRVQRVPKTETQGRVHTSTVTVAIMPEAEEIDLVIESKDLRVDVFRSGGSGGQSVNTTDSAVRITHLPTNEVVICQDEKSQLKNKNKAMKVLRARLLDKMEHERDSALAEKRKSQVGAGFRNERIRTYNFPQGRITDHRIGLSTHNIADVMNGDFNEFIQALNNHYQSLELQGIKEA